MLARRAKRTSVALDCAKFTNFSRGASPSSIALAFRVTISNVHLYLGVSPLRIVLLNAKHFIASGVGGGAARGRPPRVPRLERRRFDPKHQREKGGAN